MSVSENFHSAYTGIPASQPYGDLLTVSPETAAQLPANAFDSQFKLSREIYRLRHARAQDATNNGDDEMPLVDYTSSSPAPSSAPATPVATIPPPIIAAIVPLPFGSSSPFRPGPCNDMNPFQTSSDALPPPEDVVARALGLDKLVEEITKEVDEDEAKHSPASTPARTRLRHHSPSSLAAYSREATPRPAHLKFDPIRRDARYIDATRKLAREILRVKALLDQSHNRVKTLENALDAADLEITLLQEEVKEGLLDVQVHQMACEEAQAQTGRYHDTIKSALVLFLSASSMHTAPEFVEDLFP
ncbi:hypothetical protein C8F01DRAFT_1366161 [Mycena amicta]|nr:hypothetical protein C8F01DRAFT_1366161 [Mycena amicta]